MMTVVLTLSNSEEWNALIERSNISSVDSIDQLEKVDNSVLVKDSISLEELRGALPLYDSIILVYPAIQMVLSEELRAGTDSALAISSVSKLVDELLSTHRTARKKLKMLNMRSLSFTTSEELTLLSEIGWSLESNSIEVEDDIFTLAAYQIVHQNKKLKKFAGLLTASSMPIGSANEEVKVDFALDKYGSKLKESETRLETAEKSKDELLENQQKMCALEEKLSSVEAEGELLRLQATQLQEELEKYFNLSHELKSEKNLAADRERELRGSNNSLQELNRLQVEKISELERINDELYKTQKLYEDMDGSLTAANTRIGDLNSEIELLKAHLSVVQSELETYFIKSTEMQEKRDEALKELNHLRLNNESAKREVMGLEYKVNELKEANQALHNARAHETKQLQYECSNLQLEFNKAVEAKRLQHSEHIRETKQLQREYSKLEVKFKHQRGELAKYKHQVERLASELEDIKASGSWKISAPARAVGRVVSKVDRKKLKLRQDAGLIYTSELFDADWYLKTYPDVESANIDPAEHYLEYGAKEGRLPSASFDGNWYLKRYPDVADSDVNPLVHYLKFGQNEGRSASPVLLENFKD